MALIKCEECGQEISSKASVCPHCGCPVTVNQQPEVPVQVEQTFQTVTSTLTILCRWDAKYEDHIYKVYVDGKKFGSFEPGWQLSDELPIGKHRIKIVDKSSDSEVICKKSILLEEDGLLLEFDERRALLDKVSVKVNEFDDEDDDEGEFNNRFTVGSIIALILSLSLCVWIIYCLVEYKSVFTIDHSTLSTSGSEIIDSLSVFLAQGVVGSVEEGFDKLFMPWFALAGIGAIVSLVSFFVRSHICSLVSVLFEISSLCYAFAEEMTKYYSGGTFKGIYYGVVILSILQLFCQWLTNKFAETEY